MIKLVRVLVTCIGGGIGQSVVDSLRMRKDKYFLIGSDGNPFNYAVPDCDITLSLPKISDRGYIESLLRAVAEHNVDIVIPGHDGELPLFAEAAQQFEAKGCKVVVSDVDLVSLSRDKLLWSQVFRKYTNKVVASCSVNEAKEHGCSSDVHLPAIAKPRGGSASSGLKIVAGFDDLENVPNDYVVQSFLFPQKTDPDYAVVRKAVSLGRVVQVSEVSVQLVYSGSGELLGKMATRNRLKEGVPVVIEPIDSSIVWDAVDEVRSVIERFSPKGPINLQGRLTEDGLIFFELNPRFTGITGNRAQFGFNEVSLVIDNLVRGDVRPLFNNAGRVGVRQVACLSRPRFEFMQSAFEECKPRVIVLGGTSWLARNLIARLVSANYSVSAVVRRQSLANAREVFSEFRSVDVFTDDDESLFDVISSSDTLINCVSGRPPSGTKNISDSVSYQFKLLGLALDSGVTRIINVSSQSVYSESEMPIDEAAELDLSDTYSFGKYAVEEFLSSSSLNARRVSTVSLRLSRLFGAAAGLRDDEFPHLVTRKAMSGEAIDLHAPGTLMDLLNIHDAVDAILFFVETKHKFCSEVFNVGSGRLMSARSFVDECAQVCNSYFSKPLNINEHNALAQKGRILDITKIERLGWSPKCSLNNSVRALMQHYEGR